MARYGYYDEQYGFVPYDDCPQDNLYSESEAAHTFSPSEPKTNADRIRAMTDEELSYCLDGLAGDGCPPQMVCNKERYKCNVRKCWLDWLKQEATDERNHLQKL